MEINKPRRGMNLGDVITNAFKLVINNVLEILKVISIFILPVFALVFIVIFVAVFGMFGAMYMSSPEELIFGVLAMILPIILITIVVSLISYFGYAVMIKMLADRYMGEETGWKYATKCAWQKKWSLLGMNLLIMLMLFVGYIGVMLVAGLLGVLTFGIGFIIIIPMIIGLALIASALLMLCNSMLLIKDLTAMDAIKQTMQLFGKGSFWSMIGKCAAITGITFGINIVMALMSIIPILGFVVIIFGGMYTQAFLMSACNIIVIEDMQSYNDFSDSSLIE